MSDPDHQLFNQPERKSRPEATAATEAKMNHPKSIITKESSPAEVEQAVEQIHQDYLKFCDQLGETIVGMEGVIEQLTICLLYTSPSPRDATLSRMPSSA